jgi:hypothetical protein
MSRRYEFRTLEEGYSPVVWDNMKNEKVNFLHGDIVEYLNIIHEQDKMITELSACLKVEQNAGMELARKVIELIK